MAKAAQKTSPKKQPASLFATAKRVTPTPGVAKADQTDLVPTPGIHLSASISVVEKVLEVLKKTARRPVEEAANARWIAEALKTQKRPDNFRAVDATFDASGKVLSTDLGKQASVELRKRGTNSPLKPEEMALLDNENISYEWVPMRKGECVWGINKKYENDPRLEQWGVKMAEIGMPEDFIQQVLKPAVSEETLNEAFRKHQVVDAVTKKQRPETDEEFTARLMRVIDTIRVVGIKPVSDISPVDALKEVLDQVSGEKNVA